MDTTDWRAGDYRLSEPGRAGRLDAQIRHGVARVLIPRTLRIRMLGLVAVAVTAVVGATEYIESRAFARATANELARTAESTALALADDLEVRRTALDPTEVSARIREFIEAFPAVRAISIVSVENGRPRVVASTAAEVPPLILEAGRRAATSQATVWVDAGLLRTVATPFGAAPGSVDGAVVVSISLAAVEQARRQAWVQAWWIAPLSILGLVLLVDWLSNRFVHRPLAGIRAAMARAAQGDFGARAPVVRADELGQVAQGLNEMLARIENFNSELRARVDEATRALQQRNTELSETYQRILTLREALARAEQMAAVGHMAASVAHQVGTPLNLVSGYIQMMREEEVANERLSRRLAIVAEQIDRVVAELRTILDRARPPAHRQVVSFAEVISRVTELARLRLERQGVRLEVAVDPACPPVEADVAQLELVLLNIVTNSLDAMPTGGVLAVEVKPAAGGGIALEIRDTGPGIPPDLLPRVFDAWVTTKPAGRGTGLGLSVAREVIQGHGGSIAARNNPGGGAIITIELPAARAAQTAALG
jgi:signal transduction histidine kinase